MIAARLGSVFTFLWLAYFPTLAFAEANNAAQIDEIIQYYQAQCDEEQVSVLPDVDAEELGKPMQGVLTLASDNLHVRLPNGDTLIAANSGYAFNITNPRSQIDF